MPITPKVLGQLNPVATVLSDLYTCPASRNTTISTLFVCNFGTTPAKFRVMVAVGGAADDPKQRLFFDVDISANNVLPITSGITMSATDVLRVQANTANVSFNAFGIEKT